MGRAAKTLITENCLSARQARAGEFDAVEAAQKGDSYAIRVKEAPGHRLHLSGFDSVDARDDFLCSEELMEVHFLAGEIGHAGVGTLEAHQDVALQLILGSSQLF